MDGRKPEELRRIRCKLGVSTTHNTSHHSTATGLRTQGHLSQLTTIQFTISFDLSQLLNRADGSAYYEQGNTKVICAVYGPREVHHSICTHLSMTQVTEKRNLQHDKAIINCEYGVATFATSERRKRIKGDRRTTEIASLIRQTFEGTISLLQFFSY